VKTLIPANEVDQLAVVVNRLHDADHQGFKEQVYNIRLKSLTHITHIYMRKGVQVC